MSNRHPKVHPHWRVPAGLMLLGSVLTSPGVYAADANCAVIPSNPTVDVGETVDWSASVTGIGSNGTYRWEFKGGTPSSSTSSSPTVRYTQVGTFETKLRVDDSYNDDECNTTVTVRTAPPPANEAPTADAGPDQTGTLAAGQTTIDVTLNGMGSSDPDGDTLSYSWTGSPNPSDEVSPTVSLGEGTHSFTLTVTDPSGASDTDTVVVTVNLGPRYDAADEANQPRGDSRRVQPDQFELDGFHGQWGCDRLHGVSVPGCEVQAIDQSGHNHDHEL